MTDYDVIIAGAGPAGSSLAIHLGRMGRTVLLLDRSQFPREKPCGEGILPAGVAALRRLGVDVSGVGFQGIRYHHAGRTVAGAFPKGGLGLAIRRSCFDTLLLNAASAENNVDVRTGEVVDAPIFENGAVTGVIARGHAHKASLVVAADGVNSPLRQKLGWGTARASRRFGVRRHYRASGPTEPWVDIFLGEGSETYVTPLPGQEIGIATLGDHRGELPPSLRDLEPIDAPLGAAPLTVRPTRRFAPGCVLLGDAAGSCDPITGGGISQALLSSELLARHLARRFPADLQTLAEFDRARERMLAKYRWLASGVLALIARPHLIRPSLAVLDQWPSLFTRLLAMAGGAPA